MKSSDCRPTDATKQHTKRTEDSSQAGLRRRKGVPLALLRVQILSHLRGVNAQFAAQKSKKNGLREQA